MANQLVKRKPAIFTIDGKVTKSGGGWILVEGTDPIEKHTVTQRDAQGNPYSSEVMYYPHCVLITFAKSSDFHTRIVSNKVMRFHVEVSVGWDERFKRTIPRFWLNDVSSIEEESVFEEVKNIILKEDPIEVPPVEIPPQPAPQQIVQQPVQAPETPAPKPRMTRSSRYVK